MSDPLSSARIKLKRANLHVATAKREMFRFFKTHPQPTIGGEPYGEASPVRIGDKFVFQLVVERGYPDLPSSFAARFGDTIYNYRCVLDHIAWQLVLHGSNPAAASDSKRFRLIQFPIRTSEVAFKSAIPKTLPGVASDVIDFIHGLHLYKRGNATNQTILTLADLSNEDKHQTIRLIFPAFSGIQHHWQFVGCRPFSFEPPADVPEVKAGAKIGRITAVTTGSNPHVNMGLQPSFNVALDDGRTMFPLLAEIRDQVMAILNAPEIAAGLK